MFRYKYKVIISYRACFFPSIPLILGATRCSRIACSQAALITTSESTTCQTQYNTSTQQPPTQLSYQPSGIGYQPSTIRYRISNIQYWIATIRYRIFIKFPISGINHPISDIKYPISDVNHPISDIKYPISNINHPIWHINHLISGSCHPLPDVNHQIRYRISSIKYQVSNIQYRISNIKYRISNVRYRISTIRYISGINHQPCSIEQGALLTSTFSLCILCWSLKRLPLISLSLLFTRFTCAACTAFSTSSFAAKAGHLQILHHINR